MPFFRLWAPLPIKKWDLDYLIHISVYVGTMVYILRYELVILILFIGNIQESVIIAIVWDCQLAGNVFVPQKKERYVGMAKRTEEEVLEKTDIQLWCTSSRLRTNQWNDIPSIEPIRRHFVPDLDLSGSDVPDIYTMEGLTGDQLYDYLMFGKPVTVDIRRGYYASNGITKHSFTPLEFFLLSTQGYIVVGGVAAYTYDTYSANTSEKVKIFSRLCRKRFFSPEQIGEIDKICWLAAYSNCHPSNYVANHKLEGLDEVRKSTMFEYYTIRHFTNPFLDAKRKQENDSVIIGEMKKPEMLLICDPIVHRGECESPNVVHINVNHIVDYDRQGNRVEKQKCLNCGRRVWIGHSNIPHSTRWGRNEPAVRNEIDEIDEEPDIDDY